MSFNALKQADGLWFPEDTPVVLRAEDRVFCVSKSILAARSSVFQSMFEFPQPVDISGEEMIDGKPAIRLHDKAADVEQFLRAIFDSNYFMPPPAEIDFHAVLGILRLSHKYDVPYLFKRAILHLETVYPIELPKYQSFSNNLHYEDGVIAFDLTAIPLFQEVGATWLLPVAFYSVATYDPQELLEAGETWNTLLAETRQICFLLAAQLVRRMISIDSFFAQPSSCVLPKSCNSAKLAHLGNYLIPCTQSKTQHPLRRRSWDTLEELLCKDCFSQACDAHAQAEAAIWDQLPANCGLDGWDVLMEQRRVVMA